MAASARLGAVALIVVALTGFGGEAGARAAPASAGQTPAQKVAARTARRQRMATVVREWSTRLDAGDNAGVARLFTVPAVMVQGPYVYRLSSRSQIAAWHAALPCSGTIVSITFQGRFATAVFRLGNRGSTKCDAPGTLAAARFGFAGTRISTWQQIPVPAGRGAPAPPA